MSLICWSFTSYRPLHSVIIVNEQLQNDNDDKTVLSGKKWGVFSTMLSTLLPET